MCVLLLRPRIIGSLSLGLYLFGTGCSKDLSRPDAVARIEDKYFRIGQSVETTQAGIQCGVQHGLWAQGSMSMRLSNDLLGSGSPEYPFGSTQMSQAYG